MSRKGKEIEVPSTHNGSGSDGDRLPRNAQRARRDSGQHTPQGIARATERLASLPGSPLKESYLSEVVTVNSAGEDSDSAKQAHRRGSNTYGQLDTTEAARRLKRHLVTRTADDAPQDGKSSKVSDSQSITPTFRDSAASSEHKQKDGGKSARNEADDDEADGGYAGDVNEEEYESENADDDDDDDGEEHSRVPVNPLTLPSGDITYGIYRWQEDNSAEGSARRFRRRGTFSGVASDSEWDVPYSQNQLSMPGGFRRQFIRDRAERSGDKPTSMLTESFIDFIGLYGHFAGGDYPSDEDDPPYEDDTGSGAQGGAATERTPLRSHSTTSVREAQQPMSSNRKAFFLLIKAFVGTGVLVLPKAYSNGGFVFSTFVMMFVAWYAWHCMVLLAETYLKVGGSYSDLGEKLYGRWLAQMITLSIIIAQIGFCCAYTIFVATNMRDLWNNVTSCQYNYSLSFWVLAQLAAYVPLSMVRHIKNFAVFALLANIFIISGIGYVLTYDIWSITNLGLSDSIIPFNPTRFPLLIGTAIFSFEGITLCIPVVESMKHKEKFPLVLSITMLICIVIFFSVGGISYLAFGEKVESVILLNLPKSSGWTVSVQLLYSLAIMLSVPLQLFPAIRILESGLFAGSGKGNPVVKWQKNMFRTLISSFVAFVSVFGADQLDNFVAITGSFCCVPLSFIYPSMLHYRAIASGKWVKAKDIALLLIGVVILFYVTYIGIKSWGAGSPPADRCAALP